MQPIGDKPFESHFQSAYHAPLQDWEIDYQSLTLLDKLGEGFFGSVYAAKWKEMLVCVKKLKNVRQGEAANFWKEVSILVGIRCPFLVQFIGAATHPEHMCIVTEFLPNGSLYEYFHVKGNPLSLNQIIKIAEEVALGMNYLHERRPPILHRDLTSSNVLLAADLSAKVGDFGLSRPIHGDSSGEGGNLFYMAPEAFLYQDFTRKSDVFSFGILLCELLSKEPPYRGLGLSPALAASKVANEGLRPPRPANVNDVLWTIAEECLHSNPDHRPSFVLILQTIRKYSSELEDTIEFEPNTELMPIPAASRVQSEQIPASPIGPIAVRRVASAPIEFANTVTAESLFVDTIDEEKEDIVNSFDAYSSIQAHIAIEIQEFIASLTKLMPSLQPHIQTYSSQRHFFTARAPFHSIAINPMKRPHSSLPTPSSKPTDSSIIFDFKQIPSHKCSSFLSCSWTPRPLPAIGDAVMCRAEKVSETDAVFELIGFFGWKGMASLNELSKRKIRSMSRILKVGQRVVLRVCRLNIEKQLADLSKKDVLAADEELAELEYQQNKAVTQLIQSVAIEQKVCTTCLFALICWPLHRKYGHAVYGLRAALVDPVAAFGQFNHCNCISQNKLSQLLLSPRILSEINFRLRDNPHQLDLCNLSLNCFPRELFAPPAVDLIESLNLENNPLSSLPPQIDNLTNLKELNANCCNLSSLPLSFTRSQLTRLYLYSNNFEEFPLVLCEIRSLEWLNLGENKIAMIPESFGNLSLLSELSLSKNAVSALPDSFINLQHLRTLQLNHNNFTQFPPQLCSLRHLVSLDLKYNEIAAIPSAISQLTRLEWLDLSHNQLQSLPDSLCDLLPVLSTSAPPTPPHLPHDSSQLSHSDHTEQSSPVLVPHSSPPTDILSALDLISAPHIHRERSASPAASVHGNHSLRFLDVRFNPALSMSSIMFNALSALREFHFDGHIDSEQHEFAFEIQPVAAESAPFAFDFDDLDDFADTELKQEEPHVIVVRSTDVNEWGAADVAAWLSENGFAEYASQFVEDAINGKTLFDLDKDDLKELGLIRMGPRKELQVLIKALQSQRKPSQPKAVEVKSAATPAASDSRAKSSNGCDLFGCESIFSSLLKGTLQIKFLTCSLHVKMVLFISSPDGGIDVVNTIIDVIQSTPGPISQSFIGLYPSEKKARPIVSYVFPPLYFVSIKCLVPNMGYECLMQAFSFAKKVAVDNGAILQIVVPPFLVSFVLLLLLFFMFRFRVRSKMKLSLLLEK